MRRTPHPSGIAIIWWQSLPFSTAEFRTPTPNPPNFLESISVHFLTKSGSTKFRGFCYIFQCFPWKADEKAKFSKFGCWGAGIRNWCLILVEMTTDWQTERSIARHLAPGGPKPRCHFKAARASAEKSIF